MFSLTEDLAHKRVLVARQAEKGIIRAMRTGKPDAATACKMVTPVQRQAREYRRIAEADLVRIRIEDQVHGKIKISEIAQGVPDASRKGQADQESKPHKS